MRNGHIKRITDSDIASSVLEIQSANVSTTYISCPADQAKTLGIKLPFLILIVKNLKKYFTFEVQVLDDKNVRRRFRASNYQVWKCHIRSLNMHVQPMNTQSKTHETLMTTVTANMLCMRGQFPACCCVKPCQYDSARLY